MPAKEMPIFTRTFDLLAWLLRMTNHFPRAHRQTVTKRLIDAAFDLRERLEEANLRRRDERRSALVGADEALARLGVYLQLAGRFGWMNGVWRLTAPPRRGLRQEQGNRAGAREDITFAITGPSRTRL